MANDRGREKETFEFPALTTTDFRLWVGRTAKFYNTTVDTPDQFLARILDAAAAAARVKKKKKHL